MTFWRTILATVVVLSLAACSADLGGADGDDEVVGVEISTSAHALANKYILSSRPMGTNVLVDQVNIELANNSILATTVGSLENKVFSPMTNGTATNNCPFLAKAKTGSSLNCNYLVGRAVEDALVSAATVKTSIEQDLGSKHGGTLKSDEKLYVFGWAQEAVFSGIDFGAVHAAEVLRNQKVCDQATTPSQSALLEGEKQGKQIIEQTEKKVLPTIPKTQCNTDVIAATIKAEAKKAADTYVKNNPLCAGYKPSEMQQKVDLAKEEENRKKGIQQGITKGHNAMRVRLVSSWKCTPPPDPCLCYARYSGRGPVYCFPKSKFSRLPPRSGRDLAGMDSKGIAQCTGSGSPKPVGSPLMADLDGDGIRLASHPTISFDLAATGENALIPATLGDDALLVLDLDANGRIDSGLELFGNATLCGTQRCVDGLEALAQHDANEDGVIDAKDPIFKQIRLWRDIDRDGVSQDNELEPLGSRVASVNLSSRLDLAWTDDGGNSATRAMSYTGARGGSGAIHDVWFGLDFDTLPQNPRSAGIVSR